ncbi:MAG: pantoate--beta-alanine ligase [bacterium]|nr:pantoate--beta-alanine ligase [bacterium]
MKVIQTVSEMHRVADQIRADGLQIGLVPTMGFLHEGHLSLIGRARRCADRVVVSIFVNPTQFGPQEDLEAYPLDFERDRMLIGDFGGDLIYAPDAEEMYPEGYASYVDVEGLTRHLCGASRPGHFRGVTTVVTKLFAAVKPHVAIFGQKDAQQAAVIRRMAQDLNLDVEVLVSPTIREVDGLAKSSRNFYLSPEERQEASVLYQALQKAKCLVADGERRADVVIGEMRELIERRPLAQIDYIEAVDTADLQPMEEFSGEILLALAVQFGKARLIDNLVVHTA